MNGQIDLSKYALPEEIKNANFDKTKQQQTIGKAKISTRRSNFILTLNPNISGKLIASDMQRRQLEYAKLMITNERIQRALQAGRFVVPADTVTSEWKQPVLTHYETKVQVSDKRKWMHSHAVVRFGGTCKLELNGLRNFIREDKQYGFEKFNLHLRFVADSIENAMDYANRDDAEQQSKQENKGSMKQILRDIPIPIVKKIW